MKKKKMKSSLTISSTFSPLRKTSEYNWAGGFSQVLAHKMCTLEITKIHSLDTHTWKVLTENTWAGLMLISLTRASLQPLFRTLFFPSEAKDTVWSLHRGNPVLAPDDRAVQQTPLYLPWQKCWVLGSHVSQRRLDAPLGYVRTGKALPGQCRWVVRRSWQLWERKSELEFVMPLLKELNCKKSDSKLTQMSGLSSGIRKGLYFMSFTNAHKEHRCCGSAGWGTESLPGDPIAITEDMFQWLTNKKQPPWLPLVL